MNRLNSHNIKVGAGAKIFDKNGNLKEDRTVKNLVVTTGKNFIASRLGGASSALVPGRFSAALVVFDPVSTAGIV